MWLLLLWWLRWKRIHLQCKRMGLKPWVGKIPWRRKWLPTPVFLPWEFHRQRGLEGYSPWGRKASDTTEWLTLLFVILEQEKNTKAMSYFTERERFYTVFARNISWSSASFRNSRSKWFLETGGIILVVQRFLVGLFRFSRKVEQGLLQGLVIYKSAVKEQWQGSKQC